MQPTTPDTWALLLAHWTQLVTATAALPEEADARRWRDAVPPIVELQAITNALGDLPALPPAERALGVDRAGVVLRRAAGRLHALWPGEPLPEMVVETIADARLAHELAASLGQSLVVAGDVLEMPDVRPAAEALVAAGFGGLLLAARPGTVLFCGAPGVFLRPEPGAAVEIPGLAAAARVTPQPQVYRELDAEGVARRDVVAGPAALPAGVPLLRTVIEEGRLHPAPDPAELDRWRVAQRELLARPALPVEAYAEA